MSRLYKKHPITASYKIELTNRNTKSSLSFLLLTYLLFVIFSISFIFPSYTYADNRDNITESIRRLAGCSAVQLTNSSGTIIFEHNSNRKLIPASILKIATAMISLYELKPDFRFSTIFSLTEDNELIIEGRGDPLLISEEIDRICEIIAQKGLESINGIIVDTSFFEPHITLDGTSHSLNPYDAFNGATCVNFNTVFVNVSKNGTVTSAESQTPITPIAKDLGRQNGNTGKIRLNLFKSPETCFIYTGQLFKAFLEKHGIKVKGEVQYSNKPISGRLIYKHFSRFTLTDVIQKMMKYSNNYIANQIWLTLGAYLYNPPADIHKSRDASQSLFKKLKLNALHMEEGSGLSRRTKITAAEFINILSQFKPYNHLLKNDGRVFAKTGTLDGVSTLAGYIKINGKLMPFVIILNGSNANSKTRSAILDLLQKLAEESAS